MVIHKKASSSFLKKKIHVRKMVMFARCVDSQGGPKPEALAESNRFVYPLWGP